MNIINSLVSELMNKKFSPKDEFFDLCVTDDLSEGWLFDEEEAYRRMDSDETFESVEIEEQEQYFYQDGLMEVL